MFMTNLSKGSTYSAVVPLTAMVLEPHEFIWVYQLPEPEPGQLLIPINLVFQWRLIFDKKLKETSLPCYLTWNYWLWKIRVRPYSTNDTQLILILGWSGRWFGTGLGSSSSNELISARLSCRDSLRSAPWFSVSARSIDRDSLVRVRISVSGIEYRIKTRVEIRVETCVETRLWT